MQSLSLLITILIENWIPETQSSDPDVMGHIIQLTEVDTTPCIPALVLLIGLLTPPDKVHQNQEVFLKGSLEPINVHSLGIGSKGNIVLYVAKRTTRQLKVAQT
jgi:hypothetical protein